MIESDVPGSILPDFFCCNFVTENVSTGYLTLSPMVFIFGHLSSCFMRRTELNRGNIRMLLVILFGFLLPTYLVT